MISAVNKAWVEEGYAWLEGLTAVLPPRDPWITFGIQHFPTAYNAGTLAIGPLVDDLCALLSIDPLPRGTDFARWRAALHTGIDAIRAFGAQALVVSLGVDTFEGDPISGFTLRSADYLAVGAEIAAAGLPTVFVFEGGYAVAEVGINTVNVLEGFSSPPRPR